MFVAKRFGSGEKGEESGGGGWVSARVAIGFPL